MSSLCGLLIRFVVALFWVIVYYNGALNIFVTAFSPAMRHITAFVAFCVIAFLPEVAIANPPTSDLQNQINTLNTSVANDLRSRDKLIAQKGAEIKRLKARLDQTVLEMTDLKQDNRQLRTEVANLSRQIDNLQAKVGQLLDENRELRRQNQEILKQNTEIQTENRQVQIENRQMLVDNKQTNETNNQILIQLMHMQQDGAADAPQ